MTATSETTLAATWKPTWAVVLAWLVLVPAGALALYGVYATGAGGTGLIQGLSFSEIGVAIGVPSLLAGLLVGAPLTVFLKRGSKVALVLAGGALVLCIAVVVAGAAILSEILPIVGYR